MSANQIPPSSSSDSRTPESLLVRALRTVLAESGDLSVECCPFCGSRGVIRAGSATECTVCSQRFDVKLMPSHEFSPQVTPEIPAEAPGVAPEEPVVDVEEILPPGSDLDDAPAFEPGDADVDLGAVVSTLGGMPVTAEDLVVHYVLKG